MVLGVPRTLLLWYVSWAFGRSENVEDLLGIHEVIDMVAHRHEQVEEDFPPVDVVSPVLTIQRLASG
jgi:hypothetical protein